jgi:hypothetical protein
MSEFYTDDQRENILNAIAGYQLLLEYQMNQGDDEAWDRFTRHIEDMDGQEFAFALGLANVVRLLLTIIEKTTGATQQEMLAAMGETAVMGGLE